MPMDQEAERRQRILAVLAEHEGPLTRYAQRLVGGDLNLARDVVQHVFLQLCRLELRPLPDPLAAWLFTVCRNQAIDVMRSRGRLASLEDDQGQEGPGREADPADALETKDACEQVRRVVSELGARQREVVNLWSEGFGYREISGIVGVTEGNVRVLIHRAFQTIRRHPDVARLLEPATEPVPYHVAAARLPFAPKL